MLTEAGIISRQTKKMPYSMIVAIDLHQTVIGRLLNYGSIELTCAGGQTADLMVTNVYSPELVQALIEAHAMPRKHKGWMHNVGIPGTQLRDGRRR